MKYIIFVLLLLVNPVAFGNNLDGLIKELQGPDLSLETIAALVALDDPKLKVGYGLCEAAGRPFCKTNGTLGYGLCEVAGVLLCKEKASLGYGLCMLSGTKNCREKGSLGYGLCVMAGEKNCKP
mgnify:CR=1 FL=1